MEKNGKNGTFFWKERMPNPVAIALYFWDIYKFADGPTYEWLSEDLFVVITL